MAVLLFCLDDLIPNISTVAIVSLVAIVGHKLDLVEDIPGLLTQLLAIATFTNQTASVAAPFFVAVP